MTPAKPDAGVPAAGAGVAHDVARSFGSEGVQPITAPRRSSPPRWRLIEGGVIGERGVGSHAERSAVSERAQERGTARRQEADLHVEIRPDDKCILRGPGLNRLSLCAPEFIAQIVTTGCAERTISSEGCGSTRRPDSAFASSCTSSLAPSGAASTAWEVRAPASIRATSAR